MPEFLTLCSPAEALERLLAALPDPFLGSEEIDTKNALGRVTSAPVQAGQPLPTFPRSTVDGFAVRAEDTYGASDSLPAYLNLAGEVSMGSQPQFQLSKGQAALIYTGGMLPHGADAVVMLENTQGARPGEVEILKAVARAENTLAVGEDVAQDEVVIPAGKRLRPAEIGGLMALGKLRVTVSRQPTAGILSSGDEVVAPEVEPQIGQVRDVNSYALAALIQQHGGRDKQFGVVPDQADRLRKLVAAALAETDLVVITAGSSASTRDLTAQIVHEMGAPGVLVHGVNVRPGKPTILGVCNGKPVIGLPGNPVSALVIAGLFVVPVLQHLQGMHIQTSRPVISARLAVNLPSQAGREDWIPVKVVPTASGDTADPIFFKSNLIFNLVRADGLVRIPPDATGLSAGSQVEVHLI